MSEALATLAEVIKLARALRTEQRAELRFILKKLNNAEHNTTVLAKVAVCYQQYTEATSRDHVSKALLHLLKINPLAGELDMDQMMEVFEAIAHLQTAIGKASWRMRKQG